MTIDSTYADDLRMDVGALLGAVLARAMRIVAVTLVLMAGAYVVLMFTPKVYESSASILVESRDNAFTGPQSASGSGSGGAAVTIDALVSSQVELIKSRDTLLAVADQLGLSAVPEFNGTGPNPLDLVFQMFGRTPEPSSVKETVLQNLADKLTVIRERDSAIVSIFVRSQSPKLAAAIANAIAAEHVKRRAAQSLADTAEASAWLEQEIGKLRQRVAEAETAVAKYRADNDLFEGANNTSLVDQQLTALAGQLTAAQERRNAANSRAALIRSMIEAGQPIDGLADAQASAVIQQLSQSKATLQGELAQRSSTLLPNHPTIRALTAQIREIERQIASEGRRVATALEAEARIEADLVNSLQEEMARLKASAATAATSGVTLDELQREAKAQRDLLESYLLRYRDALSRSDSASALPDVRIVTTAAPSVTPAAPKTGLTLAAVAIGALALQVGAVIFGELLSGRAVVAGGPALARTRREPTGRDMATSDEPELPFANASDSAADRQTRGAGVPRGSESDPRSEQEPAETRPTSRPGLLGWFGIGRTPRAADADQGTDEEGRAADAEKATDGPHEASRIAESEEDADARMMVEGAAQAATAPLVVDTAPVAPADPGPVDSSDEVVSAYVRPAASPGDDRENEAHSAETAPESLEAEVMADDWTEPAARPQRLRWFARIWRGRSRTAEPRADGEPEAVGAPAESLVPDEAPVGTVPDDTPAPEGREPLEEAPIAVATASVDDVDAGAPAEPDHDTLHGPAANVASPPSRPEPSDAVRYPSAIATLGADIALGRVRVVMIAGLSSAEDCVPIADALVAQALRAGLSVVRVDAGTGEVSPEPGITDLAAERSSFGDIVHKGWTEGLSIVPWGHQVVLDRRSRKPNTLVEALTDIYEVVIVLTGRVGMSSSLQVFSGIAGRLVLASVGRAEPDHVEAALAETSALGFRQAQVIVFPPRQSEVA